MECLRRGGSTTFKICVSRDDNNTAPRATTNLSDSNYSGDIYYNTQSSINNSVSSMQNWFGANDVIFFTGASSSGSAFCVDTFYGYSSIALGWDDAFSSHTKAASDASC